MRTLLLALLFASGTAIADSGVSLDIGAANCRYTEAPDGQFWQKDQAHESNFKSQCGTVGLSFQLNPAWTVGIHYVSLGNADIHALAITCPDDNCAARDNSINTKRTECDNKLMTPNCLYQWSGHGKDSGVNFSFRQNLLDYEGFRFDAKIGAYVHRLYWTETVEPLGCSGNCSWQYAYDQKSRLTISPMGGFVANYKYVFASVEWYGRIGQHTPVTAGVKGPVEVTTIGVRIPF